jgi:Uma2 family endonuclease
MLSTAVTHLTFDEYLKYDDGTDNRYELVNGELVLMNPPTVRHTIIIKFLEKKFDAEIERLGLPWIPLRDTGVRTGVKDSRLPDLSVITLEQAEQLMDESAVFQSPPLLAVEVVSPSTSTIDYRYKQTEYAAIKIPEYWIIDSQTQKVSVLTLVQGLYEKAEFQDKSRIISQTFPELSLTAKQLLQAKD